MNIKRGEVYYADLDPVVGSEQGGRRPVLVLQNNVGNRFGPTIIVAAISTRTNKSKKQFPTHVSLPSEDCHLGRDSVVFLEQLRTIDKSRIGDRITMLDKSYMEKVDAALLISTGLIEF